MQSGIAGARTAAASSTTRLQSAKAGTGSRRNIPVSSLSGGMSQGIVGTAQKPVGGGIQVRGMGGDMDAVRSMGGTQMDNYYQNVN